MTDFWSAGFPHSEISGSMRMCRSPELIAACHVLLRLLMPRHSPCALLRLIYWFSRIMQAPFGFPSVEIVTHCLSTIASNFCLLLPCLSFALCSVFNVQMVGQSGLEPPTSRLSVVCSSQLSYWPVVSADLTGFASAVGLRRRRKFASVRSCFFKSKQPFRFECEGNRVMDLTLHPLN